MSPTSLEVLLLKEIVRAALGAPAHLDRRATVDEAVVLTGFACVVGVGLAWIGIRIFVAVPARIIVAKEQTHVSLACSAEVQWRDRRGQRHRVRSGAIAACRAPGCAVRAAQQATAGRCRTTCALVVAEIALSLTRFFMGLGCSCAAPSNWIACRIRAGVRPPGCRHQHTTRRTRSNGRSARY